MPDATAGVPPESPHRNQWRALRRQRRLFPKPIPRTPQRASLQSRRTASDGGRCAVSADFFPKANSTDATAGVPPESLHRKQWRAPRRQRRLFPPKPIPRTPRRASLQSRCTASDGGRCAVSADIFPQANFTDATAGVPPESPHRNQGAAPSAPCPWARAGETDQRLARKGEASWSERVNIRPFAASRLWQIAPGEGRFRVKKDSCSGKSAQAIRTGLSSGVRRIRRASQMPSAHVTSALAQRLVSGKIGHP